MKLKIKPTSSKIPPYQLIPKSALDTLANIFQLGKELRPDGTAWNAMNTNQVELSKEFVIERSPVNELRPATKGELSAILGLTDSANDVNVFIGPKDEYC